MVKSKIKFANGEEVQATQTATYLGASLNTTGYRAEVEARMQKANLVFYKLKTL